MNKTFVFCMLLLPAMLVAQIQRDVTPLRYWPAPLYWQPSAEERTVSARVEIARDPAAEANPLAQAPASSLVFVGMTPCRLVDTRTGSGFTGAFGPPSLAAQATRSFPLQANPKCNIPSIAQAYSLNVTVVPPGFLAYLTLWPVGAQRPVVSTLNDYLGTVVANAAIVPAGNDTSGSVDVFVSNATDLIIDINGYYAAQSGITLAQGTVTAPSLSFAGDAGTGIYSSGTGTVDLVTSGINSLTVAANGNIGIGTIGPAAKLEVNGNALVDGNLSLSENILAANGSPIFQAPSDGCGNFGAGYLALQSVVPQGCSGMMPSGDDNTAVGNDALTANTSGVGNMGVGYQALHYNTTGSDNTASGTQALWFNTVGGGNTANGAGALAVNTTGGFNTATGNGAMYRNYTGSYNTASGGQALFANSNGSNNIAVGFGAGNNIAASNNIDIGNQGTATDGGTIRIGTPFTAGCTICQTSAYMAGIYGSTTGLQGVPVVVDSNGQLGTVSSSRRYKEDINGMGDTSDGLMQLRPVTFRYKKPYDDGSKPMQYGLIAEEVAEVYPDLVARSTDGQVETVRYQLLDPMLLNELQKQHATIEAQKERIRSLEERLARVEAAIDTGAARTAGR